MPLPIYSFGLWFAIVPRPGEVDLAKRFDAHRFAKRGSSIFIPSLAAVVLRASVELGTNWLPVWLDVTDESAGILVNAAVSITILMVLLRCLWSRLTSFEVAAQDMKNITPGDEVDARLLMAMDHLEALRKTCTTSAAFFLTTAVLIGEYRSADLVRLPDFVWFSDAVPICLAILAAFLAARLCLTGNAYLSHAAAVRSVIDALLRRNS